MCLINCNCKCGCTLAALISSLIIGVVAAFLQITAVITVTPVFLWVALGIAVGFLAILTLSATMAGCRNACNICTCASLNTVLAGIGGTILFSILLLAVGIVATSVFSAIVIGLLAGSLALTLTGSICYVRSLIGCEE